MSKLIHLLFSRLVVTGFIIFLQVILIILIILQLTDQFIYIYLLFMIISVLMVIYIISKNGNPSFKIPWIVLILIVPLVGGILYLILGQQRITKKSKIKWNRVHQRSSKFLTENSIANENLKKADSIIYTQSLYLQKYARAPLYQNTNTKYFTVGEDVFPEMIKDLKSAQKFIFIEYFIIQEGTFWNSILEVLKEKAKTGVEVRVMYDDLGSIAQLPSKYYKTLESFNIKCVPFNRFNPVLSILHNNRDHRKIMIIDGNISYTGGLNLADEYINAIQRFGHWKDTCIRLEGDATATLTMLFLESWNYHSLEQDNFSLFLPPNKKMNSSGYVQPYGDSPLDKESIGKEVYMNMINQAEKYLYINTPYLIVDYDMIESLCRASKRNVDVRIMLPFKEDKWYAHIVSRSYYDTLISSGVKIIEYTPGFNHAKSFVCDDKVGVIGTINLDYRSLVHHFECGVWLYQTSTIHDMKEDFLVTELKGRKINLNDANKIPWYLKLVRNMIKFFSPLM